MSDRPIIEIRDLKTYFKTGNGIAKAVDGVSLSVNAGETYALVGESGCGKSVTALSILKLVPEPAGYHEGGSINFMGEDIATLPPAQMRRIRGNGISMIFQEPMTALNPVFTVGSQIVEGILVHQRIGKSAAKAKAAEMLKRVGIPDPVKRFDEYPHQMSGGMRQRVMIAMALACEPKLLIADEPTTALDVTIQSQILELIRDLKNEFNTAVLLITHDMGVVRENADRVGVMYAGKLVEEASQESLFASPSHPYTRLLMKSLPSRSTRGAELATIKGTVPRATDFPVGCRFSTRCPFVMARCKTQDPESISISNGHTAACWLLETADPSPDLDEAAGIKPVTKVSRDTLIQHPCVEITDLKMYFPIKKGLLKRTVGHVMAVDGTDLIVKQGETVALVGESGCGKTTVGKCMIQLNQPTSGSIRFRHQEIIGLSRSAMKAYRRGMQMIFQDPFSSLNPRMMIRDIICEGMEAHGLGRNRIDRDKKAAQLMERVGLRPEMLSRYPHEFSGGQRQRIGVARALSLQPELIICDEATSSLDVSVQAQILNLLKGLQGELGLSYLFITHDLSVVRYLADRVSVMYLGRIVEEGTNDEIFKNARHPYTKALLSAVPQIDEDTGRKRIVLAGDVPSPINPPQGCHFHPRCPEAKPECRTNYPDRYELSKTHTCKCVLCR